MLARLLVSLALLGPLALVSGWWSRAGGPTRAWDTVVYTAAAGICHQRPDRSFQTAGTPWPVCGRCSGLYLAAPVGAVLGWRRFRPRGSGRAWLAAAALPTVLTLGLEWWGLPITNVARALAALPLGAAVAAILVRTAAGDPGSIK